MDVIKPVQTTRAAWIRDGGMERLGKLFWTLAAAAMLLGGAAAEARPPGESRIYLTITDPQEGGAPPVRGRLEVTLEDLNREIALDANGDGVASPQEFAQRAADVFSYLEPRLVFYKDGVAHPAAIRSYDIQSAPSAALALIDFDIPSLLTTPERLEAEYRLLFNGADPAHRARLFIEENQRAGISGNQALHSISFGPGAERQSFSLSGPAHVVVFFRALSEGARRPFTPQGYQLLLILAALVIPLMVIRAEYGWAPAPSLSVAAVEAAGLATLLALAQTTAMSLTAAGLIKAPPDAAQTAAALGVVVIAVNSLTGMIGGPSSLGVWTAALLIGLASGASLDLGALGGQGPMTAPGLAGMAAGLWAAQAIAAVAAAPVLFLISRLQIYRPLFVQAGAIALILAAGVWWADTQGVFAEGRSAGHIARALGE